MVSKLPAQKIKPSQPKSESPENASNSSTADLTKEEKRQKVERVAYEKWEAAGCPSGQEMEFWLQAERECGVCGGEPEEPKDAIDEASEDSFPASDPPSFNPTHGTGAPH